MEIFNQYGAVIISGSFLVLSAVIGLIGTVLSKRTSSANKDTIVGVIKSELLEVNQEVIKLDAKVTDIGEELYSFQETTNDNLRQLHLHHIDDAFEDKLRKAEREWLEMQPRDSTIGTRLAKRTRDITLMFFREAHSEIFTEHHYCILYTKVRGAIAREKHDARLAFPGLSEERHKLIDESLDKHVKQCMIELFSLAKDQEFNEKHERLQNILIRFYKNYREDIVSFLQYWRARDTISEEESTGMNQ
jgi:hypothetical protein